MNGWIKLHRKTLKNPIVCKDADHLAVWCYLLLNATHDDLDVVFGTERITLVPGQLITGRKKIARDLAIDENKVYRILKSLKIEQQIEQQANSKGSLITIVNWESYQKAEQPTEQQVNNERTATEQQVNTNKNERSKEGKNKDIICSTEVERVVQEWNRLGEFGITNIRYIKSGTERQKLLRARLKEYGVERVIEAIDKVRESDFLRGKTGGKPFFITFDWFVKPSNFQKIIDGNYDNRRGTNNFAGIDWENV